jgi:hypothetical protein
VHLPSSDSSLMRPARRISIGVAMIERPVRNPRSGVEQFEGKIGAASQPKGAHKAAVLHVWWS